MSTYDRINLIIRMKKYEADCAMRQEQVISSANLEALRKTRAEIEAKMKSL